MASHSGRALAPLPLPLSNTTASTSSPTSSAFSPNSQSSASPYSSTFGTTNPTPGPSLTAKQWVVPPRPKPGRKPATDTPPTKRKAQNRAAQRAFRERRAAKVGELETQMEETEREHQSEVEGLQAQMAELQQSLEGRLREAVGAYESDLRAMEMELGVWKVRCRDLEGMVVEERRKNRMRDGGERDGERGGGGFGAAGQGGIYQTETPPQEADVPVGCGRCTLHSRCQCVEDIVALQDETADDSGLKQTMGQKRALSPASVVEDGGKRVKQAGIANEQHEQELETDFTNFNPASVSFSTQSLTDPMTATSAPSLPFEPCGFCQDGSTCLCAELAAENKTLPDVATDFTPNTSTDLTQQQCEPRDPSLSTHTTTSNSKQPAQQPTQSCNSDPGTCTKCRSSPTSTLLCKTLAASQPPSLRSISSVARSAEPCPLGSNCCRVSKTLDNMPTSTSTYSVTSATSTNSISTNRRNPDLFVERRGDINRHVQAITGPTISCADAFTTLSRHPAFERASKDLGEWLPRLVTIPAVGTKAGRDVGKEEGVDQGLGQGQEALGGLDEMGRAQEGAQMGVETGMQIRQGEGEEREIAVPRRTAFDIEAASVMGVLRMFDRRFGGE